MDKQKPTRSDKITAVTLNLGPKKSLGQHWLKSPAVRRRIIEAAELKPGEAVVEVGPGRGFLTSGLLAAGAKVVAVEKDRRLVAYLQEKFSQEIRSGNLELICDDILNFEPGRIKAGSYKLVANIPYYLTSRLLRRFLTADRQPERAVLMMQKEVARRIVGSPRRAGASPKESILSLSVKAYGRPRCLFTVPAGQFSPRPRVDSAVLVIAEISKARLSDIDEKIFFSLLKRGFGGKRKMLKNSLAGSASVLQRCKIKESARAEELTLDDWLCLTTAITKSKNRRSS